MHIGDAGEKQGLSIYESTGGKVADFATERRDGLKKKSHWPGEGKSMQQKSGRPIRGASLGELEK